MHRTPSERSFGLSVGSVLLAAGLWTWWRGRQSLALALLLVAAVLIGGGLLAPALLRGPNRVWWRFAQALGWFNARVILTLFFFLVLTPVGAVMRLAGRSPLKPRTPAGTNWAAFRQGRRDPRHFERLF